MQLSRARQEHAEWGAQKERGGAAASRGGGNGRAGRTGGDARQRHRAQQEGAESEHAVRSRRNHRGGARTLAVLDGYGRRGFANAFSPPGPSERL
jgi:hypothetical protein